MSPAALMVRLITVFALLMLAVEPGSAHAKPKEPPGELLASIEVVKGAFGPVKGRTGWWFQRGHSLAGYAVTGYEYRDGRLVDEFGGGSEQILINALDEVGLVPFDFDAEVEAATQVMASRATEEADLIMPGVRDGALFRVTIVTSAGTFRFEAWNPGSVVDGLAPFSTHFARLKRVFDLLRGFYADAKFQF